MPLTRIMVAWNGGPDSVRLFTTGFMFKVPVSLGREAGPWVPNISCTMTGPRTWKVRVMFTIRGVRSLAWQAQCRRYDHSRASPARAEHDSRGLTVRVTLAHRDASDVSRLRVTSRSRGPGPGLRQPKPPCLQVQFEFRAQARASVSESLFVDRGASAPGPIRTNLNLCFQKGLPH